VTAAQEQRAIELMSAAQAGDAVAYADLLTALVPIARHYVLGRIGPRPCAEDIVQETLVSIHRARHTYDASRPFAPWFYAVLANRLIDTLRREQRIARHESGWQVLPEPVGHVQPASHTSIDSHRIHRALASLPPRQREVVTALKMRDESVREIGSRLGMTQSAVKVTAHRGYRALRRLLGMGDT